MNAERGTTSEILIDRQMVVGLLEHSSFKIRLNRGLAMVKKDNSESGFSAGIDPLGNLVFSNQVKGSTTAYAKDLDDFIEHGGLLRHQVDSKKIKFRSANVLHIADFHFHPSTNTTPSYYDANHFVSKIYGYKKNPVLAHKRMFGGIFAGTNEHINCLFYGLGRQGLVSTDYQAWDSTGKASGYKDAMRRSGFWIVEGTSRIYEGKPIWDNEIINQLAMSLQS